MTDLNSSRLHHAPNPWALTPLVVFLLSYLVVSIIAGDFYKMPITVAFVIASVVAIAMSKGGKISNRIEQFCRGAANSNIMLMVLIFILAGAFAQTAKAMGAVDATVNLAMSILPGNLLAAGIFLAACFISISVGTSVGTIVALAPRDRRQNRNARCPDAGCRSKWSHVWRQPVFHIGYHYRRHPHTRL